MVIFMNERINEVNKILKDLFISARTQNLYLTERIVYSYLTRRGVSKNDLKINMNFVYDKDARAYYNENNFFGKWIEKFKNKKNINVFCSESWKYFCQFVNGDYIDPKKIVKLYIPLDYNHIYEGVNRIFNFLADNNINHLSKVSSNIRFDDVVVRLGNMEDARKLQQFIDNDKYIQEGMIKTTPFTFNKNGVGYAYDGNLSFNAYVSAMIADYINMMIKNSRMTLDDINISSFYTYVDMISKNSKKIKSLLDKNDYSKIDDAYLIVQLIKKSLVSNDIRDYEQFYNLASDVNARANVSHMFNQKEDKRNLLDELILTTMKKYPLGYDRHKLHISGWNYIISYLNGNINAVTRDNNLRLRVKDNLKKKDVFEIVNNSGIIGNNITEKLSNYTKMVMLNEMIRCLAVRNPRCVVSNIREFIKTNDFTLITNSVDQARRLAFSMQANDIKEFFKELGVTSIDEYIEYYYNKKENEYRRR